MEIRDGAAFEGAIRALIEEYTERLGRDLGFQDLEGELADPLAKYGPPGGGTLVAVSSESVASEAADGDEAVLGMVAFRGLTPRRCEMKRLYVRPAARGMHLGDALVDAAIDRASRAGYGEMVLDTIKPLAAAVGLYRKHGFELCAPYYDNPMPDVIYLRRSL